MEQESPAIISFFTPLGALRPNPRLLRTAVPAKRVSVFSSPAVAEPWFPGLSSKDIQVRLDAFLGIAGELVPDEYIVARMVAAGSGFDRAGKWIDNCEMICTNARIVGFALKRSKTIGGFAMPRRDVASVNISINTNTHHSNSNVTTFHHLLAKVISMRGQEYHFIVGLGRSLADQNANLPAIMSKFQEMSNAGYPLFVDPGLERVSSSQTSTGSGIGFGVIM